MKEHIPICLKCPHSIANWFETNDGRAFQLRCTNLGDGGFYYHDNNSNPVIGAIWKYPDSEKWSHYKDPDAYMPRKKFIEPATCPYILELTLMRDKA